uniref:C-X-C motif chemokine n=1 Tax=Macaca mulatta TaxID=9544 RepID=A0A5F7ZSJ9_MACMU
AGVIRDLRSPSQAVSPARFPHCPSRNLGQKVNITKSQSPWELLWRERFSRHQWAPPTGTPLYPGGGAVAFLQDSGLIWSSGNFPDPAASGFPASSLHKKGSPIWGSHRARVAGTSPPALPLLAQPPDPSAEPHGPRRALRSPQQSSAPAGGAAAPAPGGHRKAGNRWVPSRWGPRVGRCWGGRPAPTAQLNQRVCSSPGAPVATELRCQCLQTLQGIHPKNIQSVIVKAPGPHCAETEVIATLKNGQKACLNPASPMVQKIIEKILNK